MNVNYELISEGKQINLKDVQNVFNYVGGTFIDITIRKGNKTEHIYLTTKELRYISCWDN